MHISQGKVDGTASLCLTNPQSKDIGNAGVCWQVFEVDESAKAVQQVSERVDMRGGAPARLHGGALLGVTFASSMTSGLRSSGDFCQHLLHRCYHVPTKTFISHQPENHGLSSQAMALYGKRMTGCFCRLQDRAGAAVLLLEGRAAGGGLAHR